MRVILKLLAIVLLINLCHIVHGNANAPQTALAHITETFSNVTLFEQMNLLGPSEHIVIANSRTCVDLRKYDKANSARSLITHGTCVTVWYTYDCTGWSAEITPTDGLTPHDLRQLLIKKEPNANWKQNIGSISECEYAKWENKQHKLSTRKYFPKTVRTLTLLSSELSNSAQIAPCEATLYENAGFGGINQKFDIPNNRTCVDLRKYDRANWAQAISTADKCLTVWHDYECTGWATDMSPLNGVKHNNLNLIYILEKPSTSWSGNIGSLSSCDYEKKNTRQRNSWITSYSPRIPRTLTLLSSEVTSPDQILPCEATLYENSGFSGISQKFSIPNNSTCVDLRKFDRSNWAQSISTHGKCVTAWHGYECTGWATDFSPSNGDQHRDLNTIFMVEQPNTAWNRNIRSLSRCDFEQVVRQNFDVIPALDTSNINSDFRWMITVYQGYNYTGTSDIVWGGEDECKSLNAFEHVSSIYPSNECVKVWTSAYCTGKSLMIHQLNDANCKYDLRTCSPNVDKQIRSVSSCAYSSSANTLLQK